MVPGFYVTISLLLMFWLAESERVHIRLTIISGRLCNRRFHLWTWLVSGCVVAYFSAHFLQVPDIRFLPPLGFALLMVLCAETLGPFVVEKGVFVRALAVLTVCYLVVITVVFGAKQSGEWYRFNNRGYEMASDYKEFSQVNEYLSEVYRVDGLDPLNAPRVGYEKSDRYGAYGGDRVFESLPFFSGRQTLEGIHYAGSMASRFIAFVQTEFSEKIKTPKPQILSRINPEALPAHFDLYNISQLVVMTDRVKKALESSRWFKKEIQFGNITLYRYTRSSGRYVEVPKIRPVLYSGDNWVDEFFEWYKDAAGTDVLFVPAGYVSDSADRAVFQNATTTLSPVDAFRFQTLNREGLEITSELDHLKIRFSTNKVGLPHLIKVSYFPNWTVEGANGVYPVSPHLMMVIPRERVVTLTYARSIWERVGMVVTIGGLIILLSSWILNRYVVGRLKFFESATGKYNSIWVATERYSEKIRPFLFYAALLSVVVLIVAGIKLRNKPVRIYEAGYRNYQQGIAYSNEEKNQKAIAAFRNAVRTMKPLLDNRKHHDHLDVVNCILTSAMCLERLGDYETATNWYQRIPEEYPYSRYVAEANVKTARILNIQMKRAWAERLKTIKNRKNDPVPEQLENVLERMRQMITLYRRALDHDPYSVWIQYAVEDLKKTQEFIDNAYPEVSSLPQVQDELTSLRSNLVRLTAEMQRAAKSL